MNIRPTTLVSLALLLVVAPACGSSVEKNNGEVIQINADTNGATNGTTNGTPEPGSVEADIKAGITVPDSARSAGVGSLQLVAEGVFLASNLATGGAQLVTTGTLTQQGQELNFTYDAEPSDRLRVVWSEGNPTEFFITTFEGDFSNDATTFVNGDHSVAFRVARDGSADMDVTSQQVNGQSTASMKGTVTVDGVTYDIDLGSTGEYSSQVEITSAEHESLDRYTGTITASDGFQAQIDETYRFKLLVLENGVTNEERFVNNTWTVGSNSYAAQNVRVRYETLNGWANLTDYWIVEGSVLQNGSPIGQMTLEDAVAWISIVVALDNGEQVEVQRFMKKG